MRDYIIRSLMSAAVSQGSKYLTRPLVLKDDTFDKVSDFIDRVEKEVRPFESIDLDKPMSVIRASANFAKSKIAKPPKKRQRLDKVDISKIYGGVDKAVNAWMQESDKDESWSNYDTAYNHYLKHLIKKHGFDVIAADESKKVTAEQLANQLMAQDGSLSMLSMRGLLDFTESRNLLTKHLIIQKEITVLGQVVVNEEILTSFVGGDSPCGYYTTLTLYGAYAPPPQASSDGEEAPAEVSYETYKNYVLFITAEVHKIVATTTGGKSEDRGAHDRIVYAGMNLMEISKGGVGSSSVEKMIVYVPTSYLDATHKITLMERLREVFWQHHGNIVEIVDEPDKPWVARKVAHQFQSVPPYHGKEKELWADWEAYMRSGIPNTVLLWGRPGCGKTTLIREGISRVSRDLGKKCLIMDNATYKRMSNTAWTHVMEKYKPDVVWVDDIDRVDRNDLSTSLVRIDRNHYKVPLTLFTSNSLKRIPPAFYRTDRIDYIYQIQITDDSLRLMMSNLLAREGVSVPELTSEQFDELLKLSTNGTAADMLKYIRRGKILGWDRMTCPFDQGVRVMSDED